MNSKNIIRSVLAAELILVVPLLAMLISDGANWDMADFVIAVILLAGVGVAYQLFVTGIKSNSKQAVIGVILAAAMLLLWVEMAVGLFGSPIAGS